LHHITIKCEWSKLCQAPEMHSVHFSLILFRLICCWKIENI